MPLVERLRSEAGFSLVEMLAASMVLVVVVAAITSLTGVVIQQAGPERERALALREAQVGLDRMTRELRQASAVTEVDGRVVELRTVLLNRVTDVRYDCSNPWCRRWVKESGVWVREELVIDRISQSGPVFEYVRRPGETAISLVRVSVAVASSGEGQESAPYRDVLRDGVYVRNVGAPPT